jgi:hypothetical protein
LLSISGLQISLKSASGEPLLGGPNHNLIYSNLYACC